MFLKQSQFQQVFGILALLFFGANAYSLGVSEEIAQKNITKNLNICRSPHQKLVRTVRIQSKDNTCETIYSKKGIDRTMANGQGLGACLRVHKNIVGNLREAGWKCREVSQGRVEYITTQ